MAAVDINSRDMAAEYVWLDIRYMAAVSLTLEFLKGPVCFVWL